MQANLRSGPEEEDRDFEKTTNVTFRVCYYLKGGLSVERNYFLWVTKDRMAEPGTYDNMLDSFVNSTAMKLRRLRFDAPRFEIRYGDVNVEKRGHSYDLNSREQEEIMKAIAADAQSGAWGQYDWFNEDDATYAVYLSFWYSFQNPTGIDIGMDNVNVYLRPGMTNTIDCLKSMGYLKDDDLITRTEMRKIWEEMDARAEWNDPDLSGVYYDDIPWNESEVPSNAVGIYPATEAVTPQTVTEGATLPNDVDANPNSAPQTPVESSIASANAGSSANSGASANAKTSASAETNAETSDAESVVSGDTASASVGS